MVKNISATARLLDRVPKYFDSSCIFQLLSLDALAIIIGASRIADYQKACAGAMLA